MRHLLVHLCLLTAVWCEPSPQGKAALEYLEVIRDRPGEWQDASALFDGTTKEKRESITKILKRLSKELQTARLRVISETQEGDLAAVLVSRTSGLDIDQLDVIQVGLLKKEDGWLAAPIPGSFDNTGITYLPDFAKNAQTLERWMLREASLHLIKLRNNIYGDLLKEIRDAMEQDELMEASPEEIVSGFMKASREKNLPRVLAYLGGLEEPLPESFADSVTTMSNLLGPPETATATGSDSNLSDHPPIQAHLHTDLTAKKAIVTFGKFDPKQDEPFFKKWVLQEFQLTKNPQNFWRMHIPPSHAMSSQQDSEDNNPDLYSSFPSKVFEELEKPHFTSADELAQAFLRQLNDPDFQTLLSLYSPPQNHEQASQLLMGSARLWWHFQSPANRPVFLELHTDGDDAWLVYYLVDINKPDLPHTDSLLHLKLIKEPDGWAGYPQARPSFQTDLPEGFQAWKKEVAGRTEEDWLYKMGMKTRLGGLPAAEAPTNKETETAAKEWIKAFDQSDFLRVLGMMTAFDDMDSIDRSLDFTGLDLSGGFKRELLAVHRNGRWAGASVKHSSTRENGKDYLLLHPIIGTEHGPRFLTESVLYHADTRSKKFLNDEVWGRLRKRLPEAAVAELEALYQKHESLCDTLTEQD